MNQLHIQNNRPLLLLGEKRKCQRFREVHLLAITCNGTGKIVDINRNGLSFGCLYPHNFPEVFTLDILDAKGLHLKRITVRKTWQRDRGDAALSEEFEMEVGAEFLVLPPAQEALLAHLLAGRLPAGAAGATPLP